MTDTLATVQKLQRLTQASPISQLTSTESLEEQGRSHAEDGHDAERATSRAPQSSTRKGSPHWSRSIRVESEAKERKMYVKKKQSFNGGNVKRIRNQRRESNERPIF
jgi:hypothetical protein